MNNTILSLKKNLYKDIIFSIIFVLISIPIWMNFDASAAETAKMYDNYNYIEYEKLNNPVYSANSVSDTYAVNNIETQDIIVANNSNTIGNYKVVLKINENENIDALKVNVNNDIKYLKDYSSYNMDNYNYFILDEDAIVATTQKYVLSLWNDETINNTTNNLLDCEFEVI